jgi:hypothetical protein
VLVERAHAGNAQKIFQFAEETLLIIAGKIHCGGSHELVLSGTKERNRGAVMVAETFQYTRRKPWAGSQERLAAPDWTAEPAVPA